MNNMKPDELRAWREKNGYTQESLSRALDVDRVTIARWETGVNAIPRYVPYVLAELKKKGGEKKHGGKSKA